MNLTDRLPPSFPPHHRLRLDACESHLRAHAEGPQVIDNVHESLNLGLLTQHQFEHFCDRLANIFPTPPDTCSPKTVVERIDHPTPLHCQGAQVPAPAGGGVSRVMDTEGFLFASLKKRPNRRELNDARTLWQHWPIGTGSRHTLQLRGQRAFFWVTPTERLSAPTAVTPDELRNLLGLHYREGRLLEVQLPADASRKLHRPTVMDALDHPRFYPCHGPEGWGMTDDLNEPTRCAGRPEAVTPMDEMVCEVKHRGALSTPPPR